MKCIYLIVGVILALTSISEGQSYLKDLEEQGYCVIPEVLSRDEAEVLYKRVWHEFIEQAWPNCRMDDRSNWKETFPMHNRMGIFAGPAGQTQVMWDLRQDPRIVGIFGSIWNTDDLIVSMDGLSFMCPPEIRKGYIEPWPHVDQAVLQRQDNVAHSNLPPLGFVSESSLKTQPYTIQGQFLFEDSYEGDGGFYCIPRSHLRFSELAPQLEGLWTLPITNEERKEMRLKLLTSFFGDTGKQIKAPKGSLILWDSRTVHWNQHADVNRKESKVRMVGYLCYVPKSRMSSADQVQRLLAFQLGVSTGHNPIDPEFKFTKDHIYKDNLHYLEDPNYKQPEIQLTPLGKSLLGLGNKEK